jgi:NTE family protein/lysophospholipid hydrolase
LGRLGPGECLGEFSFLTRKPRTASVRAVESTELLELSATDMDAVVGAHPRLHKLLHQMYRERALVNVLARSPLFEMLSAEDRDRVAAQVDLVTMKRGETVVRRGEGGGAIYLVKSGKLEVRAEASKNEEIKLATLSPHQFFGEVSFLTGVPRTATVIALEESELLKLNAAELRRLVEDYPVMTRVLKRYHLDRVMATAETLKSFLRKERIEGVLR